MGNATPENSGGTAKGALKRILIVDDEKPIARALQLKLQNSGYEAEVVFGGDEALALLRQNKFDLLILDLVMPKLDGFHVLEELRRLRLTLPVIVSTNLGQEEDVARVRAYGVAHYFIKSEATIADMVSFVRQTLR